MKHVTHLTHDVYTYVYNTGRYGNADTHTYMYIYINAHILHTVYISAGRDNYLQVWCSLAQDGEQLKFGDANGVIKIP
jgi:hypothetical protein